MRKYYINTRNIGIQSIPKAIGYDFISININKGRSDTFNYIIPIGQVFSAREAQTLKDFLVTMEKSELETLFEPIERQTQEVKNRRNKRREIIKPTKTQKRANYKREDYTRA